MKSDVSLRLREHPDAPRWTVSATDGLEPDHLSDLDSLRAALASERGRLVGTTPADSILQRVSALAARVPSYRHRLGPEVDIENDWVHIETSSREDLAVELWKQIPDDADLEQLIVYRTAGTTGHVLQVPHHPVAAASYLPLLEVALGAHDVDTAMDGDSVGLFLVGAQARTVTFATTLSGWNDTGFAKLNLRTGEWPSGPGSANRYFDDMAPRLLTGDPISFAEMLRQEIPARPRALVTTAVAMNEALRQKLTEIYGCPVIDWYSLTETGPIGYRCSTGDGYHLLPHDLFVEALDTEGRPVAPGERGEITVTGGRNPYLPLLRYRTGDWGRLDLTTCKCGDPTPRIRDLEGRVPVLMRSADGDVVNPVDLSRVLREFPFVQHELTQQADLTFELVARPVPGETPEPGVIAWALRHLLGQVPIVIRFDEELGNRAKGGKVLPYRSELLLED